jgi:hypothetical protein
LSRRSINGDERKSNKGDKKNEIQNGIDKIVPFRSARQLFVDSGFAKLLSACFSGFGH